MTTTTDTTVYAIDPAHSSVGFAVRHMMLTKVRGTFAAVSGTIELPAGSTIPAAARADIDVSSVDTREPQRDGHLKSEDFFHAEKHTHIRFASTGVTPKGGDRFELQGTLEIKGVAKPVVLDGEVLGRTTDPWGNDRVAFEARGRINRKDFGLTYNQALETGGVLVGEEVELDLQIQAVAKK